MKTTRNMNAIDQVLLRNAKWRDLPSIVLAICTIHAHAATAAQTNQEYKINAAVTQIVHGFCIGVIAVDAFSTNNTSVNDSLAYFPWTTNEPAWISIPTDPEYAYQVDLFDTSGTAMPKTELGKRIGAKFSQFGAPGATGIAVNHSKAKKLGEMAASPVLFRTSDLFVVAKPGNYTLRVRFQILAFPTTGPNPGNHTNDLIRFPPLDYPLIKSR